MSRMNFRGAASAAVLILSMLAAVDANSIGGRIYNGQDAAKGQFPYQAFLRITKAETGDVVDCGGSVLSDRWIITAAHCAGDEDSVEIILGVIDYKDTSVFTTHSEDIEQHPDFEHTSTGNDICLIKTVDTIPFSDLILPIDLPPVEGVDPSVFDDMTGVISGWGRTLTVHRGATRYLQWANVHIMAHNACKKYYRRLLDSMVCTDDEKYATGTCNGDSGGPLVSNDNTPYLIGLVSYAQHDIGQGNDLCGKNPNPKVFTNVAKFLGWISDITGITDDDHDDDVSSTPSDDNDYSSTDR